MEMDPVFLFGFLSFHSTAYLSRDYNKLTVSQKHLQAPEHPVPSGTSFIIAR